MCFWTICHGCYTCNSQKWEKFAYLQTISAQKTHVVDEEHLSDRFSFYSRAEEPHYSKMLTINVEKGYLNSLYPKAFQELVLLNYQWKSLQHSPFFCAAASKFIQKYPLQTCKVVQKGFFHKHVKGCHWGFPAIDGCNIRALVWLEVYSGRAIRACCVHTSPLHLFLFLACLILQIKYYLKGLKEMFSIQQLLSFNYDVELPSK